MTHTAIDGDISDFIDMKGSATEYRTDNLRRFLLNEGHPEAEVTNAIRHWQMNRFMAFRPNWETFGLTTAGKMAVDDLRERHRRG